MILARRLEGLMGWLLLALGALLMGGIFLYATLISPSALQWTGAAVHGQERSGIVFYSYGGQRDTLDDPGSDATRARTVYVEASNPAVAMIDSPVDRWIDILTVGGSFAASVAFVVLGYGRRWRRTRRRQRLQAVHPGGDFGQGLDTEFVTRLLERHRMPPK